MRSRAEILAHLAAIEREVSRRRLPQRLAESCFGPQRKFVQSDARMRAAVCGRRAGKSYAVAVFLLLGALATPGSLSLYIAISRPHAKRILWPTLHELDRRFDLDGEFREGDLTYGLHNGSKIWLTGCPDTAHIEVFRGPAYRRVAIDEGASFPGYLTPLIEDVLIPALSDYRGELALISTPGVAPTGYLHDVATDRMQGWEHWHHWTMTDNPHLPHAEEEMADMLTRRGWTRDHPTYRREWLGQWVADTTMLVYGPVPEMAVVTHLPDHEWRYILGVDLGASETHETTAYALIAYSTESPVSYVVETQTEAGATPSSIAHRIREYQERYEPDATVMDAGALGVGYVREIQMRHGIAVKAARKLDKLGAIELMRGDIAGGNLRYVRTGTDGVRAEMAVLPWSSETRLREKPGVPNHQSDAALYAWREAKHFAYVEREKPPQIGSREWIEAEEERIIAGLSRKEEKPWWAA